MAGKEWFRDSLCKVHLDMHCPEWDDEILSRFDARAIVREVKRTGSDCVYFFAKDHYGNCYYNTTIGHKSRCAGERDLLQEMVDAGREAEIKIIAYYSIVWDINAGRTHPEWLQRGPDGKSFPDITNPNQFAKWLTVCHNTGYADYAAAMLDEIVRNYDVAGLHLDMFHLDFGGPACYCDTCQQKFEARFGCPMPTEPAWNEAWRRFLEFRYDSVDGLMHKLVDTVHAVRPGLFVTTNYHGSPGFGWREGQQPCRHTMAGSMNTGETYTPAFGDMYPGMEARFLRGIDADKALELVCWRMNRITDFTVKPLAQYRWEAMTALAHGASAMVIDQCFHDGRLDPVAYDRTKTVFEEMLKKRQYGAGRTPKHAAIYYSLKTRDWYGRDDQFRFQAPIAGAYKALVESHFMVDFLFDELITAEKLSAFPVLVLPNTAIIDGKEKQLFEQYVAQGGTLVGTFETSRFDQDGKPLDDFMLTELFGVSYKGVLDNEWHFWRGLDSAFGQDIDPRYAVLGKLRANLVQATTARGLGELVAPLGRPEPPDHFFSHNVHPPREVVGHALYVNTLGKGMAIYIPHPVDASYADAYELPEHRLLLRNAVASAGHVPQVEIMQAPLTVETLVRQTDSHYYVHFLSFHATRQSAAMGKFGNSVRPSLRMDEPCMYRARLRINTPFGVVSPDSETMHVSVAGNEIEIVAEDVHNVLIIRRTSTGA